MKFSHSLRFNAVPEWIDYYIAYDQLKKLIFQIEKERFESASYQRPNDIEKIPSEQRKEDESRFLTALDLQLNKVVAFYMNKEEELFRSIEELERILPTAATQEPPPNASEFNCPLERIDSTPHAVVDPIKYTTTNGSRPLQPARSRRTSFASYTSGKSDGSSVLDVNGLLDIRSQLIALYVSLSELEAYVELNRTGFDKILKKYDKVLDDNLREAYNKKMVAESHPFTLATTESLRKQIERLERIYADTFCNGLVHAAVRQMKTHLRDQITYDRNTVWKDMIGQERKTLDARVKEPPKSYRIPFIRFALPAAQVHNAIFFILALVAFIVLLNVDIFGSRQENYCFALLIFAAILWATEAIPLYATSLLMPFLIVLLGVLRDSDTGAQLSASAASKQTFAAMFSGTIMMLLGGFALAAALSKYGIAKAFASHVLSRAGTRPRWVLLSIMFVAGFLSMWISNVATPVLCFSLIDPILRTLPDGSSVAPCLLLGIALASCIGGMTSPISSPQNIVTLQYMNPNPGWGNWFAAALPISILSILICWALLLLVYRPDKASPHLNKIKPTKGKVTKSQVFVMFITIATIALWCAETSMEQYVGDTGIIAAIPLFMFFGTGILKKDDLNGFLWSVVVLAQGGMALGNAVTSSGLLYDIGLRIKDGIGGLEPIAILCIFAFLILVFATFVSHTVAALIIIPIVQQVGEHLPVPRANLLVMGAGLACSAGMGLPVSGYPNMSAVMLEDRTGKPYLTSRDFIITGIPVSICCTVLIFTLGYGIMAGLGY